MEFTPGDTVQLKSGGPRMTVERVGKQAMTEEDGVWCVWFDKVGNKQIVQRDTFLPVVLKKVEKSVGVVSVGRGSFF